MRKWFLIFVMTIGFIFPSYSSAQADITLSNVSVQLWPEYDQPSMLVIVDFEVASDAKIPEKITFQIPAEANLIAVAAYTSDNELVNAIFDGPNDVGQAQSFTISMNVGTSYRFEYYQPITFNGAQRTFSYIWNGTYQVDSFNIRVLEPVDTVSLNSTPEVLSINEENGLRFYTARPIKLTSGQQFQLDLNYEKSSDTLASPPQGVQPSAPVNENTPGHVSLSNSFLYLIGGLGAIMILVGAVYYWQSARVGSKKTRRRARAAAQEEGEPTGVYCSQCGTRAREGDRFCRVCGARLRHQQE